MTRILFFFFITLIFVSCNHFGNKKEIQVPANVDARTMKTLLEGKDVDMELVSAYLEKYATQYEAEVKAVFNNSAIDTSAMIKIREKKQDVEDVLSDLKVVRAYADKDLQFDIDRYSQILERSKQRADSTMTSMAKEAAQQSAPKVERIHYTPDEEFSMHGCKWVYANAYDGFLNVRKRPSAASSILTAMYNGSDGARYLGRSGNWYKVDYHGTIGYVNNKHCYIN